MYYARLSDDQAVCHALHNALPPGKRLGLDGIFVHDSTTIGYLLAPELYTTVSHPIRVDTAHGVGRGKTWPATRVSDRETPWSGRRDVTICVDVQNDAVVELEMARLLG